jgi:surface protein
MNKKIVTSEKLKTLFIDNTSINLDLINIIIRYTEPNINVEFASGTIENYDSVEFENLDCKDAIRIIIYGVLYLKDPKDKFAESKIKTITGNIILIGDLNYMFSEAKSFTGDNDPDFDINDWDTSQVTDMTGMFSYATNFNSNIGNWDTSKVTSMCDMFRNASVFTGDIGFGISKWDTSQVTDMSYMFDGAKKFNSDISNWDTSKVESIQSMFKNATNFNQDLNWNTSQVTSMNLIFLKAESFKGNIKDWNTSKVENIDRIFGSKTRYNQNIINWNVSNI